MNPLLTKVAELVAGKAAVKDTSPKIREFVTHAERGYLQLRARRVMKLREDAKAKNETWNDVEPKTKLECGAFVTLKFFKDPENPRQELTIEPGPLTPVQVLGVAEELFGGHPDTTLSASGELYTFIRKANV